MRRDNGKARSPASRVRAVNLYYRSSAQKALLFESGRLKVTRQVKDFVRIDAPSSLDDLISRLNAVRDVLPEGAETEITLRGNDVFGRHVAVAFMRPQTAEEAECDARAADAVAKLLQRQNNELDEAARRGRYLRAA